MGTWSGSTTASPYHGFVVSEIDNSLSGPFKYPRFVASTGMPDNGCLVGLDSDRNLMWTDMEKLRDSKFDSASDPFTTSVAPATSNFVVGNASGSFNYYGRKIATPFAEPADGDMSITDALYFDNAYLSIAETGPMHLSSEHEIKQLHEVLFSFKTNSVGHLWCYAENEDGQVQGQYKGSIAGKHRVKVFLNLRGREFRIRIYIATHKDYPWQIQEVAIGHIMGKAYT
tara:strand:+ start:171 stop:854 length:684 start_codon:yes stop_codon:yes gene_type:complete